MRMCSVLLRKREKVKVTKGEDGIWYHWCVYVGGGGGGGGR